MSPIKWFILKQFPDPLRKRKKETQEQKQQKAAADGCVCAHPTQTRKL